MDCLFCKIVEGRIPSPRVLEDENAIVIKDIQPHAKQHYLVIPKKHMQDVVDAFSDERQGRETIGSLFSLATKLAEKENLGEGFRAIINTGVNGGQTIFHLHLHILGGQKLTGKFA